jgi:hypothetical protein
MNERSNAEYGDDEYNKVIYVWNEPQAAIDVPSRLTFRAVDDDSMETLVDAVALVMANALDRGDQKAVKMQGAKETAEAFVAEAKEYF